MYIAYKYINQVEEPPKIKFVGTIPQIAKYLTKLKSYRGQSIEEIIQHLTKENDVSTSKDSEDDKDGEDEEDDEDDEDATYEGYDGHYIILWTPTHPVNPMKITTNEDFHLETVQKLNFWTVSK